MPEEQEPSRDQTLVKHVDDFLSRSLVEVDEDVTAKYRVDPSDHPDPLGIHEVQVPKVAVLPDPVDDVAPVGAVHEVGPLDLGANGPEGRRAVDTPAGGGDAAPR